MCAFMQVQGFTLFFFLHASLFRYLLWLNSRFGLCTQKFKTKKSLKSYLRNRFLSYLSPGRRGAIVVLFICEGGKCCRRALLRQSLACNPNGSTYCFLFCSMTSSAASLSFLSLTSLENRANLSRLVSWWQLFRNSIRGHDILYEYVFRSLCLT